MLFVGGERTAVYLNDYRGYCVEEAVFYIKSRHELERENEARVGYDSNMLWMIAQPTRKHPERLMSFEQSVKAARGQESDKRTGESILNELVTKWGAGEDACSPV